MKRRLIELTILIAVLGALGLVVLVTGVVPIKASSGHWAITRWVLDFASDRSVAFYSSSIDVPPLEEPSLITLGAATYEANCVFCHGQPGEMQSPVAQGMTPTPPRLSETVAELNSQELFYIVKHGIKFAGMPAWPTLNRDDEIWPVVAFLHELPAMDHQTYLEHIRPTDDPAVGESKIAIVVRERCAACHGVDGNGRAGPRVPLLAGQSEVYLRNSLVAFRAGKRSSGIMRHIAHHLTDSEIQELAAYFAKQTRAAAGDEGGDQNGDAQIDDAQIDAGRQLAQIGHAKDKIPSCVDCHGPDPIRRSDEYPTLAGQPAWYIERQLELLSQRHRGGSEHVSLMHQTASKLSQEQRHALAAYYSSLEL